MMILVAFIGAIVWLFSYQYMRGDTGYRKFLGLLPVLVFSIGIMVCADNLFLLLAAWILSNLLLIRLMVHKPQWKAARMSGWLTAKTLLFGFSCLMSAFMLLYYQTGHVSIQDILNAPNLRSPLISIAIVLIALGAMTQSAIWPFHRWLASSLNSPTPVSAIMHAGLVNGGGFLLARFATLFVVQPNIMTLIFILGIITAVIGTLWKLMQHDVKRMLACSTIGQMGFMIAQCGLGLFPAAIVHLCWHSLFKAHLFLASGGVVREKKLCMNEPVRYTSFVLAVLCGIVGSYLFSWVTHKTWFTNDTSILLLVMTFIAATSFALSLLNRPSLKIILMSVILTSIVSTIYGASITIMESFLAPLHLTQAQPLNTFLLIGLTLLVVIWLVMLFKRVFIKSGNLPAEPLICPVC
jgi:NAD(P)H-quinone oxidoreductase subunit 5